MDGVVDLEDLAFFVGEFVRGEVLEGGVPCGGEIGDLGDGGRVGVVGEGLHEVEELFLALLFGGGFADGGGDLLAFGGGGFRAHGASVAAFGGAFGERTVPDVAVADRVAVVLEFERAFFGERVGFGATAVAAAAFEGGVVLDENPVEEDGEVAGFDFLAVFEDRAAEDDVIDLPLAGGDERVGHGRVDAVD